MRKKIRKKIIRTRNKEIYEKLNMLKFLPEVVLTTTPRNQIVRIIKSINKDIESVEIDDLGNYLILRKKTPIDFDIYLT